jgi:UDP-N-acetylglucosamine acyltransferase
MNQPLAYVHPGAKIAKNVVIEFYNHSYNVVIGDGTWIGSNVTIMEGARMENCNIFLVQLSAVPQDLKFWRGFTGYHW